MNDRAPRDELDQKIAELSDMAQAEYDEDPVGHLVGHLDDTYRDFKTSRDESPPYSEGFVDGFKQALYTARKYYLTYSDDFECECPPGHAFPEPGEGEEWVCIECGATLAEDADEVKA